MKVIPTEYEPQVRAVPAGENQPATSSLPSMIKRRRRLSLIPAAVDTRLFHAL